MSNNINFSAIIPHQSAAAPIQYAIPYDSTTAYYHHSLFQHLHQSNDGTAESGVSSNNVAGLTPLPASFFGLIRLIDLIKRT